MTTDAGGGVWTYSLDLARGLRGRGIDVVLAAMGPEPTPAERLAAEALGVRLEHAPLRLEWMADPWPDLAAAGDWLLELESRHVCDLVHLNGYALARCPFASPKIVVAHSCVLTWWEAVLGEPAPEEWARYQQAVSEGLASAAHVVAPTRWMREALARHYGELPLARASIIHAARPPGVLAPSPKHPFVLGTGRVWDEAKNLRTLARAGRSLPWPVKIAGPLGAPAPASAAVATNGPAGTGVASAAPDAASAAARADGTAAYGDAGVEAVAPDGAFEGVDLLGALAPDDLADLYARAPIFAAPARYEPTGLSIHEAALSGCALVLGDIPSLRELWDDAAVFVPPEDVEALSACLHDLVRHPEMRHEMGLEAQARAAVYRYEDMIDAYARVYASAGLPAPASAALDAPPEESECTSSSSATR
jgi:glycosyltransferase involved in cell wall biosynthesis